MLASVVAARHPSERACIAAAGDARLVVERIAVRRLCDLADRGRVGRVFRDRLLGHDGVDFGKPDRLEDGTAMEAQLGTYSSGMSAQARGAASKAVAASATIIHHHTVFLLSNEFCVLNFN